MKIKTLFFVVLIAIIPAALSGQVGKLLRGATNKAVNAVGKATVKEANKEIDSAAQAKADKAVSKTADSIRVNSQGSSTEASTGGNQTGGGSKSQGGGMGFGRMMGGKVDLKYKDVYNFGAKMYMVVESYEKDKKEPVKMDLYMYYSSSAPDVGMETNALIDENGKSSSVPAKFVLDAENKCFIILTESNGSKTGIISEMPDENAVQSKDGNKDKKGINRSFTKTGNTRMVAGYKCDEYLYKDEDDKSYGKVWFTKDANLKIDKRGWQKTGMGAFYGNPEFNEGALLASEGYSKDGKLISKSETIEINTNFSHSISVKEYNLMQLPSFGKSKDKK
jgi:hypothetical protein